MVRAKSSIAVITMSRALSLKLQNDIFDESEEILPRGRIPRSVYFNVAINLYNKL